MGKFAYINFDDHVSDEIEKEYNRMLRAEHYQEEKDIAHGVMKLSYDPLLHNIADNTSTPEYQHEIQAEERRQSRLKILPAAMEWLRIEYPEDYELIRIYYFSEKPTTLFHLAQKYGITKQAMSKRFAVIKDKLKEFIIMHESDI